jgi:hypothetical protein
MRVGTAVSRVRRIALLAALGMAAVAATPAWAANPVKFSSPQYVDLGLGGGEPFVFADPVHHTLVYSSHEGTTHLYRPGLVTHQLGFFTHYRNQVNVWTSSDKGRTWQFADFLGTGFTSNPTQNQGFSDPDLTQDAGGRIYNTGIDLANDALFSSGDGGKTWDRGTLQCHEGDRPWLAGGKADEVFLATNSATEDHVIMQSTDGGTSCSTTIPGASGQGKLYYDPRRDSLVEPALQGNAAIGVTTWHRGDAQFTDGPFINLKSPILAFFPSMAIDDAGNIYLVWTTDERAGDNGGCSGGGTPQTNGVYMAVSKDFGKSWSKPVLVSSAPGQLAFWPWAVAGDAGKLSIVWYQSDKLADLDCEASFIRIYEAHITGALDPATMHTDVVNASGRPIGDNQVCQGGTGCVATGGDRRLGDYFTNALDENGCVMIASGDVMTKDGITGGPLPTSLPVFIRQTAGPALRGNKECSGGLVAAARKAACRDRSAPASRIAKGSRIGPHNIRVVGTSRDRGCRKGKARASAGVARVSVAVGRVVGGKCRFLRASGSFSPARSCSRPIYLKARGTKTWHFDLVASFPAGTYKVTVRATDAKRNVERPGKRQKITLRRR